MSIVVLETCKGIQ